LSSATGKLVIVRSFISAIGKEKVGDTDTERRCDFREDLELWISLSKFDTNDGRAGDASALGEDGLGKFSARSKGEDIGS
jgi:hypothetical protein